MTVQFSAERQQTIDFDLNGHIVVGNVLFGEGQALSDDLADLRVFDIDISRLVNKGCLFGYFFGGSGLLHGFSWFGSWCLELEDVRSNDTAIWAGSLDLIKANAFLSCEFLSIWADKDPAVSRNLRLSLLRCDSSGRSICGGLSFCNRLSLSRSGRSNCGGLSFYLRLSLGRSAGRCCGIVCKSRYILRILNNNCDDLTKWDIFSTFGVQESRNVAVLLHFEVDCRFVGLNRGKDNAWLDEVSHLQIPLLNVSLKSNEVQKITYFFHSWRQVRHLKLDVVW